MELNNTETFGLYRPLDASRAEIRLLVLSPPQDHEEGSQISGTLTTVSLDHSPTYDTLSYVWGVPEPPGSIRVDGIELRITPNLAASLRRLISHEHGLNPIWIDAICINQRDFEERASQVSLMGRVFRHATNVFMWLGEGDDLSDWAIDRMNDAGFHSALSTLKETARLPTLEEMKLHFVLAYNLEKREYWTRAWILQEVVLPENDPIIICGHRRIQLSRYMDYDEMLSLWVSSHPQLATEWTRLRASIPILSQGDSSSLQHRAMRQNYRSGMELAGTTDLDLGDLVWTASFLSAIDPRDHIYSILGIVDPEKSRRIHVDYHKAPEEVFQDAFTIIWTLEDASDLFGKLIPMFSFHRPTGSILGKMPSWVPDLTNHNTTEFLVYSGRRPQIDRTLFWRQPAVAERHIQDGILYLKAFEFDVVSEVEYGHFSFLGNLMLKVYHGRYDVDGEDGGVQLLAKLESIVEKAKQTPVPDSDPLFLFNHLRRDFPVWKTFTSWLEDASGFQTFAGTTKDDDWLPGVDRDPDLLWEILMQRKEIPEHWRLSCPESLRSDEPRLRTAVLRPLLKAMGNKCISRAVFVSKHGFVGVGSLNIEEGDVLILLVGMSSPYVLRPYEDGYHMVGFAHVPLVSELTDWTAVDECLLKSELEEKYLKIY